jgi:transcription antitermination factor NusG
MTDSLLEAIRRTIGVSEILCACGTDSPAVVPDGVIDWLRQSEHEERTKAPDGPVKGDVVRIKEGPFAGFEGRVTDLDKRGVVEVELTIFGRLTPAIFEVEHVEITKLAKSRAISSTKPNKSGRAA